MDFKVLIAESALADLKEIVEFVAEDNREAAIRLGERLVAHALSLATMPQRFPFHDKRRGIRKMPRPPFSFFTSAMRARPS
jgi:plasmid stabilization system protein ParE